MKLKYLIISCFVLTLASCQDFLVQEPQTELDSKVIYNSESTAKAALTGAYSVLANYDGYGYRYHYLMEASSGLGTSVRSNASDFQLASMALAPNDVHNEKLFNTFYNAINITNDVINGLSNPESTLSPTIKAKIKGEASFVRGLCYFNLVRMYGRVSIFTKPATSYTETHVPRSPIYTVYKQIINDLDSAFVWMANPGSQQAGRPHKYAAEALLAKVYLTMATNDSVPADVRSTCWDSAYFKALNVVNSNAYSLVKPYSALFGIPASGSATSKNNKESIFEIQFAVSQGGNSITQTTLPLGITLVPNSIGNQWGKTRPNKETFDLFTATDPRRDVTFIHTSYQALRNGATATYNTYPTTKANGNQDSDFPFYKKFVDATYNTSSNCNFVVYRFADLLLVLAEAANELDKTSEAVQYANMVLARARDINGNGVTDANEVTPADWTTAASKDELRQKILIERIHELTGEGELWFTTRRRLDFFNFIINQHNSKLVSIGALETALNTRRMFYYCMPANSNGVGTIDPNLVRRSLLFPYPEIEIIRNDAIPQGDQNFGYGSTSN